MYCRECGAKIQGDAMFCPECGYAVVPYGDNMTDGTSFEVPAQAQVVARPKRSATRTLLLCFLWAVISFVFQILGYFVGMLPVLDETLVSTTFGALGSCLGIVVLGGGSALVPRKDSLLLALKKGWWVIAVALGLMSLEIGFAAASGELVVEPGWLGRLGYITLLCLAIGVSEETMFRGLLLGGLLDCFGRDRRGLYTAVIITSVVFGMAHIDWTGLNYLDPLSILQALLKVAQTGIYAFFLAALTVSAHEVVGVSLLHGLDDLLLMIPSMVLLSGSLDVEYVSTGEDALAIVIFYLVVIALYTPLLITGKHMLDKAPLPELGVFHK